MRIFFLITLCWTVWGYSPTARASDISLAGTWRFALDRQDQGLPEKWYARDLTNQITLPGILQAQGWGDDITTNTPWVLGLGDAWWKIQSPALREHFSQPGQVKVPFLSQPPKHYLGAAWYQRDLVVPNDSSPQPFSLYLERVHWQSQVWLDDRAYPPQDALGAPHVTDLGPLSPGKHRLTIRVDNRTQLPVAGHLLDSHSLSDALGASWNGIVGQMELRSTPLVWLHDFQNFPHYSNQTVEVHGYIGNATTETNSVTVGLNLAVNTADLLFVPATQITVPVPPGGTEFAATIASDAPLPQWDEFHPAARLWLTAAILKNQTTPETLSVFEVPAREVTAQDKDLLINGRPVNLRFTHFGGDFPLTGYPAMDTNEWRRIIRICQAYGLNGMRFHSWCPPEAAFVAADELGFYLQPECSLWGDFGNAPTRAWLEAETDRVLAAFGNHSSFILLSPSNEPKGYTSYLPGWAARQYQRDPRRLYAAATGWSDRSQVEGGAQYAALVRYGDGQLRNSSGWFGRDYRAALTSVHIPVMSHEVGQWCAYPDFSVMHQFTGYLQPGNYEIFKYIAAQNGVLGMGARFAWASGRFQLACYKEEIEANLRTPGLAGFQLLDLHDYLGQGTALIGVLDAFWQAKGYASAREFSAFCSPVVPLARLSQRTFATSDPFLVPVEAANYGPRALTNAQMSWRIRDQAGKIWCESATAPQALPWGKGHSFGSITVDLSHLPAPGEYRLEVSVGPQPLKSLGALPPSAINTWNFWVYPPASPAALSPTDDVLVTTQWPEAEARLAAGGKVFFQPAASALDASRCPPLKTVPVFWNIQMTVRPPQNPQPRFDAMLGLYCETNHPALAGFPTEPNCDWEWTPLINDVRAINLTGTSEKLKPIVWAIDDWNRNWKLGVIFECQVGPGRLLVSAIPFPAAGTTPGKAALQQSLLTYLHSPRFQPSVALEAAQARQIFNPAAVPSEPERHRVFDPDLNDGSLPAPARRP